MTGRCDLWDLPVDQCACPRHRGEPTPVLPDVETVGQPFEAQFPTIANIYKTPRPTAASAALVADLYDRMWATEGPSPICRSRAVTAGKHDRWDDDTIDDPAATPQPLDRQAKPGAARLVDLVEVIEMLMGGETLEQVAARLDVQEGSIITAARRRGTPDQRNRITLAAEEMKDIRITLGLGAAS